MKAIEKWSLQDYANEINRKYSVLLEAEKTVENTIFEIGELLNAVKAMLPHGQFIPWIETNCNFTRQHANKLMLIERRRKEFVAPPTSITRAIRELRYIDQMTHPGVISTQVSVLESPRGKLYSKLAQLYEYLDMVRNEGYHNYMVIEYERDVMAELMLRLAHDLRVAANEINPSKSYIGEVKS